MQFGLQDSPTYKLLPIFKAYESGSTASPTEITAVKISNEYPFAEIERTSLNTNLITFDVATSQYLIDNSKTITGLLDNSIYYLEFKNGYNVFTTEPFLVSFPEVLLYDGLRVHVPVILNLSKVSFYL